MEGILLPHGRQISQALAGGCECRGPAALHGMGGQAGGWNKVTRERSSVASQILEEYNPGGNSAIRGGEGTVWRSRWWEGCEVQRQRSKAELGKLILGH